MYLNLAVFNLFVGIAHDFMFIAPFSTNQSASLWIR